LRSSADQPGTGAASVRAPQAGRYDGYRADDLERSLDLGKVVVFEQIGSTLDVAHALAAAGAPAGTLVLADAQTEGRGRMGRSWRSEPGAGIWLTLIERPVSASSLDVLSLRIGLALAPALDAFAGASPAVRLKWPNDVYLKGGKVAGILVEARWREQAPEWVAIGVGINVRAPSAEPRAAGLGDGVSRVDVLTAAIRGIRAAAATTRATLDATELASFAERDMAAGRRCVEPIAGRVRGIDATGSLVVDPIDGGAAVAVRAGSLVLEEEMP
jgi:BirA family biotin operon repressor/biotin-[acetyl-CoA-carboxylase] ligase